jgi:hypothetical protein
MVGVGVTAAAATIGARGASDGVGLPFTMAGAAAIVGLPDGSGVGLPTGFVFGLPGGFALGLPGACAAARTSAVRASPRLASNVFDVDCMFKISRGAVPRLKKNTYTLTPTNAVSTMPRRTDLFIAPDRRLRLLRTKGDLKSRGLST